MKPIDREINGLENYKIKPTDVESMHEIEFLILEQEREEKKWGYSQRLEKNLK